MVAIGIDLGTTNSCVASYTVNGVEVIQNRSGSRTTPSFVLFSNDQPPIVGTIAKEANVKNCQNLVYDSKRMIGKVYSDKDLLSDISSLKWPFKVEKDNHNRPIVHIPNLLKTKKEYYPEEISAIILTQLKRIVEEFHLEPGKKLVDVVITVPAYFNDSQREATKEAAKLAGLNVLKLLNEPSAAGLALWYQRLKENLLNELNILVYDLGGGTFDVSIMNIKNGEIVVKAINGDTHLGGNDFDARLIDFLVKKFKEKTNEDVGNNKKALWKLRDAAIKAKEHLSDLLHYEIFIESFKNDEDFEYDIKRNEFDSICQDLFDKTMEIVDKVLKDANMSPSNINKVLLVGGSSIIPKVQELLTNKFGGDKINKTINGDEAVAYGAAIQAAIINGEIEKQCNMVLMDVIPLSIGISVKDCDCNCSCDCKKATSVLIPRNSKIPTKKSATYQTGYDNQTEVKIKILEGEHKESEKNNLLGEFTIGGIPKNKSGAESIEVTYEIDANGMLTARAKILSTGKDAGTKVNYNKKRLNSDDVKEMIKNLSMK